MTVVNDLAEVFCHRFAPYVEPNWANSQMFISIRPRINTESEITCNSCGLTWSGKCINAHPFYSAYKTLVEALPNNVSELQIKYFCGNVCGLRFNMWNVGKSSVSPIPMQVLSLLNESLRDVRCLLKSFGQSGCWVLSGSTTGRAVWLRSSMLPNDTICAILNGELKYYSGSLKGYGIRKDLMESVINTAISRLSNISEISISSIEFCVGNKDFSSGYITESINEPGSVNIYLV